MAELSAFVDDVVRRERGRIVGALLRLGRSLDAAEEAFQEAVVAALQSWPQQTPANPGAWLMTAAKHSMSDARRRRAVADAKAPLLVEDDVDPGDIDTISDDHLRLILTCCHPDLAVDSQIALTLKLVAGFSTEEIARAFVCSEATVSQRILRAKRAIESSELRDSTPDSADLEGRVGAALGVVYSLFNEGHTGRTGPLMRLDLQAEALRLGRLLCDLVPGEPDAFALLAIMTFSAARAHTRVDEDGAPILLAEQDRGLWNRELLREGLVALARARSLGGQGAYVLLASIAATHVTAPTWESTDWGTIVELYDTLARVSPSPIVELNRAIAVSMVDGPSAGLALLGKLEPALASYHLFYATRAELLERLGRNALPDLQRALELATNDAERKLLEKRLGSATRGTV
ncbi:MAG TPA: sigma-70 family RNA polymerase sigma factor [Polyangiaceae bacterium]|nr:sigma-70 family RNA polymerase sigma factor [Polyangiaceae bacterium]